MADQGSIRLSGGFSPGTKVALVARTGDFFTYAGANTVDQGKVGEDATVTFSGLPEGTRYWVVSLDDDERRAIAVTAKVQPAEKQRLSDSEVRQRLSQTRPDRASGQSISGPRTTTNTRVLSEGGEQMQAGIGVPTEKDDRELEPQPRLRQEDARNVAQRSATITGTAHPVEAGEPQPKPVQEDFRKVPQRSATELGEATPIEPKPDTQEDAKSLRQRSATEVGVAEVKPAGDPVHQALTRDASVKRASGVTGPEQGAGEPAAKKGEQGTATPKKPDASKASQAKSETKQAAKPDAAAKRQIRRSADEQSNNSKKGN